MRRLNSKCGFLILFFLKVAVSQNTGTTTTTTKLPEHQCCLGFTSDKSNVRWPDTEDRTISQPPCVNAAKELVYMECTDGVWGPEPECFYVQPEKLPQCPDGFTEIEDICYLITPKSVFPPVCPSRDTVHFNTTALFDLLQIQISEPVWVPVTRDVNDGLGVMRWVEPGFYYKTEYNDTLYDATGIKGKDCLVYDATTGKVTAVSCYDQYSGICAFEKLHSYENKLSNVSCFQSEYFSKTIFFCVEYGNPSLKAEFVEPYQNNLFNVSTGLISFGLERSPNGTYVWSTSQEEISYTYWSPDAVFGGNYTFGALTSTGWILTDEIETLSLVLKEVAEEEVSLELTFNSEESAFELSVLNPFWLETTKAQISCFTNADPETLLHIYSSSDLELNSSSSTTETYSFKPVGRFPGHYWCEAFTFANLELVKTQKVLYNPNCWEFVIIFQMKFPFPISRWDSETLHLVYNYALVPINDIDINGTYYIARIMKFVDVDEINETLIFNVHLTLDLKLDNETTVVAQEYHFDELKSIISTAYQNGSIEILSFLSSNFCRSQRTNYGPALTLNWPTTPGGQKTTPVEFCFGSDGNLVTNVCDGDFIDGFRWTYSLLECTILKMSVLSEKLLPLYYDENVVLDEDIQQILEMDVEDVAALDVFLLVEIYKKFFSAGDIIVQTFQRVVAQLQNINDNVLLEAQIVARSTDTFLAFIDDTMIRLQTPIEIIDDGFALFLYSDVSGVVVQSIEGNRTVIVLKDNWTLRTLLKRIQNIEQGIWLSPELRNQIKNVTIAFSLFYTTSIFREYITPKNISTAFGLNIQDSVTLPGPVSIIQKMDDDGDLSASCLYWTYEIDYFPGFWMEEGKSYTLESHRVCDFRRSAHFAFDVKFDNVIDQLQGLLQENIANADKVNQLAKISEKYAQFDPHAVFLVAKILETVKDTPDNDLTSLAKIVDNLHRIEKSVLAQSQDNSKATDMILHNVDNIIKNYRSNGSEILITTDNFIIFVASVKENDASGLLLQRSDQSFQPKVLTGDLSAADVETYENFSSSVLLSPDLKSQLDDNAKIIITVFFGDVLFNGNQNQHQGISKIFGVVLPEIGNFSGPVSILHNISSTTYSVKCVHWNYSTNNQNSYWKKDSDANDYSFVSQCDFWHTTHFALLLINDDQYQEDEVLYWISMINSALSLTGVVFIIITAVLFERWRNNIGNQILLNFSVSILLQLVTFYVAGTSSTQASDTSCIVVGAFLHYSTLSEFCWMLVIGFLQFKRFVKVFAVPLSHPLLKACIVGWILPLIPVVSALFADPENYASNKGLCYPSGSILYVTVWIPVAAISLANLVIFVYIAYSITNTKVERCGVDDTKYHWRLFALLFFMLGLTWSFGFLAWFSFGVIFAYLFTGLSTLQGFVLFLYYIVLNGSTRRLYVQRIKKLCNTKKL